MTTSPSRAVQALGQSIWYDNIQRSLLRSGAVARMIAEQGLAGLTSNPSIFEQAITGSRDYDEALAAARRAQPRATAQDLFYDLAIDDIRAAADLFAPLYRETDGRDGLVSLEVSPDLAYDAEATIAEAEALFRRVERPNLLIKVPATQPGLQAIETLIDRGINVNVTLLFSIARYESVVDAYMLGLEARLRRGQPLAGIRSVASFFVSRVDALIDRQLQSIIAQAIPELTARAQALLGQIAIANAKLAYQRFQNLFHSPRFGMLAEAGAHTQRLLWGSTSTKNPAYDDLHYVETLIGADTINTLPPATFVAFNDHGQAAATLDTHIDTALGQLTELEALGIDLGAATRQLESDGVDAFAKSYHNLLHAIEAKVRYQAQGTR
ncbi:MAG: transaldolase [Gammaproteobacteria bacterium]|nr:transaldolase [Gammaproteobacteria bacterium]